MWLTDAKMSERAWKLAAAGTNQDPSFLERAWKLAAENSDLNDEDDSMWPHNYRISRAKVPHTEKVYSNLRQQLKRKPEDKMEDLDLITLIWGMFMIFTQQAAPQFIWAIIFGEFTFNQKSVTKNNETNARCNK